MSVMTAGEQKRRAGAARGRPQAAPGQQAATRGEQRPRPAARRPHAAAGQRIRHLTLVPPLRASRAARPEATGGVRTGAAPAAAAGAARGNAPGAARMEAALPQRAQARAVPPQATGPLATRPESARAGTPQPRPVRIRTRLTRRGRVVIAALITAGVVLVAALAWLAGTVTAQAAGSGAPASAVYHSLRSVVVQPGESLWAIAARADPSGDPRNVMQEIIDINALRGTSVQPGQRLWLPRG